VAASLAQLRRCRVAVDLDTVRTRVYVKKSGLVVDEPSVAALDVRTGALIAVGTPAARMAGRTPGHIRVVRPITGNGIVDIAMMQRMLRQLLGRELCRAWRLQPALRAAVCVPYDSDPIEQAAAVQTLRGLGASRVDLVETPIAAAIGCGLPIQRPEAGMVLVLGAVTTQIAVLSLGSVVAAEKIPTGGESIDSAIIQHLRHRHALTLPSQAVPTLQQALSSTGPAAERIEVHGRDMASGLARHAHVDARDIRSALDTPLGMILDGIGNVLRRCPPDLVADLAGTGIVLCGGRAALPGLDEMLQRTTGMPVRCADSTGTSAVEGLGALIEGRVGPVRMDEAVVGRE
jgi:rod shape-determining protein MreB